MLTRSLCASLWLACLDLHSHLPTSIPQVVKDPSEARGINKWHISYLIQAQELSQAIDLYRSYEQQLGHHDFEILQQMATIILEQGMKSGDPEQQLTSIFGASMAGMAAPMDCLEAGVSSPHPQTQMASIQSLGRLQDDRSEELLKKAMASDFFFTRMEAAHQLSARKSLSAVGQIEALMYRIPPPMRFFFPPFFALIGTQEAISVLKHLMDEPFPMTRIEAILSAAQFGRDDLLPAIRWKTTHALAAEQETCATALGLLKDSKSLPLLKKLADSPCANVRLAALLSLQTLGENQPAIFEMAKAGDLYAICALGQVPESEETLYQLTQHENLQVRFNATFALLLRRDIRCLNPLMEFILRDSRDLGFQPHPSIGHSLQSWKIIPSATQHQKKEAYDLLTLSLNVREYLLRLSLELPEEIFLSLASSIFQAKQRELIPSLVRLLENLRTPQAIQLLKKNVVAAGAPMIRAYCLLTLVRLQEPGYDESAITPWLKEYHHTEIIEFRPMLPWDLRIHQNQNAFELTPQEHSQLLILCYQTLAERHNSAGIDILLEGLKNGHPKNRAVLAGLLIYALQ